MPLRLRTILSVALLGSLSLSTTAHADPPPAGDARTEADDEFNEGKRLMDAGQTSAACARFARSQEIDPKLGRLLNLAFCHEQEGKTASAWNEYNGAAALAEQKGQSERVDFAREHAAAVAKKLAFVHLDVPVNAVTVEVDGTGLSRERWPTPLPFDPGEHKVVASAPGKKPLTLVVVVGQTPGIQEFRIAPLEDDSPPPPPQVLLPEPPPRPVEVEAPAPPRPAPSHVPAFIATGVAVAGVAVGAIFGLDAMSKRNDANQYCPSKICYPEGRTLISDAQSAATASTIGFGVGLAGAAAATWLFIRPPGGEKSSARLAPMVGPRGSGLVMVGSF
ncbi:MAG: hypothetical protein ACLP1X_32355 [Polyangiaceae bacterium]|jgi:hypothetical protein